MGKGGPRLCLRILVENLVRRDQGSDDVRRRFEALEEVLVVPEPLSQWEALDILELHVCGCLGHCQRDGHPSMNATLNHQDVGGVTKGLYLREQFCPKRTKNIRL
jgi:hypothetical protein